MGKLQDYLNGIELPKVKTDVEVKPSTSLITTLVMVLLMAYFLFGTKK